MTPQEFVPLQTLRQARDAYFAATKAATMLDTIMHSDVGVGRCIHFMHNRHKQTGIILEIGPDRIIQTLRVYNVRTQTVRWISIYQVFLAYRGEL
jgi:hypothetical protein